jgi:hypothetical protein
MAYEIRIVPLLKTWITLPTVPPEAGYQQPTETLFEELLTYDRTDDDLKQLALDANSLFYGLTLDPTAIAGLSSGYALALYLNVRYNNPVLNTQFPVRQVFKNTAGEWVDHFPISQHSMAGLCLLAGVLSRLHVITKKTTSAEQATIANNTLRLYRRVCWLIYTLQQTYAQFDTSDRVVFACANYQGATPETSLSVVYMDEAKLNTYIAAGHTPESIAEYFLANEEDPAL